MIKSRTREDRKRCSKEFKIPIKKFRKVIKSLKKGKSYMAIKKKKIRSPRLMKWQRFVGDGITKAFGDKKFESNEERKLAFANEMEILRDEWRKKMGYLKPKKSKKLKEAMKTGKPMKKRLVTFH